MSSLPPATRDISEHPASDSVTDPVDKAKKDADVERKIGLYSMINALRQGRMPTNAQIDQMLQYVLDHSPIHTEKLSPNGKKLVQDTREIIETLRVMVKDKNADELLQQFFWHTRDVDAQGLAKSGKERVQGSVDAEKAASDRQQAAQHLRTIFDLVLTNSEVRKLLSDFSIIGRDLLSAGLTKAAETLKPTEEELAGVDRAAPQDQFVTEGGRKIGPKETPVLEANVPGTDKAVKHDPKTDDAVVSQGEGSERPVGEVVGEAQGRAGEARERAKQEVGWIQTEARGEADRRNGGEEDVDVGPVSPKKSGLKGRLQGFKTAVSDKVPGEHKERIERGKKFLLEDYFPEERRDQFLYRGKKVILECQKHDHYQESLRWLLSFIEDYAKHGRIIASSGTTGAAESAGDKNLKRSITEIRTLLERFANGESMYIILDAINVLSDDGRRDKALNDWFSDVNTFSRQVLLEPGYVLEPGCNTRARELRESGRRFYDDKYKSEFDNLFSSIGTWFSGMGDDPINKRFGEDWKRLTKDLLFDSEGSLTFKKDLWNDIRKVILPELVDKVGYIPIPRIEYTDDSLDLVVENLTLSGRNLFPNVVSIEAHNFIKFSPYNAIKDESRHRFTLTFAQMQADMRDVMFYFKKKSGIPKLSDSGVADVLLGGNGLTATATLVSAGKDRSSVFKVDDVHVKVHTLKFSIRDSKHDLLYKTLHPLAARLIKRQIKKAIADAIETGLEYVDGQLVKVRDEVESTEGNEEKSRSDALKNMFKKQKDEVSSTTSASHSHSQFKVVSNRRQSLLAHQGHPQGWVSRAAEKEKLETEGEEWRSEAFSVQKQRESKMEGAPGPAKSRAVHV